MTMIKYFILAATAAIAFSACGSPAANTPASNANAATANANTAKPTAAAPTKDALVTLEKSAYEAWKTKDAKFWDTFLADNFAGYGATGRLDKAKALKEYSGADCDFKSYTLSDDQMTPLGPDAAVITYKVTVDGTCGGQKIPSPSWAAGAYVRSGDKWKGAFHAETPVVDPKAPPAKPAAPAKKDAAPAKPADAKTDAKPDAATDALLALEKKAWEAWKAKDAKALDDWAAKDMVSISGSSGRTDRATSLKMWAEDKCEIKSISFTDGMSAAFGADVSLLLFNVAVDGKCDGQAVPAESGATIYIKEGGSWKAVMAIGTPVK